MIDSHDARPSSEFPVFSSLPDRRRFLTAAAAIGLAGPALAQRRGPGSTWPAGPQWDLDVVRSEETFHDGTVAPFFRFRAASREQSNGTLPLLRGAAGAHALLSITNTLDFEIQPRLVGVGDGPVVPPGATRRMVLRLPRAGTWLLTDARLGRAAGPVGLGAVIVTTGRPRHGTRDRRPAQREYVLVYQDADERWNLDVDAGLAPDVNLYEPNLHTLNGRTFPDTLGDPDTRISCAVGERVLLRIANLGWMRHAIHFHGYHVEILERDHRPETALPMKDTIPLPGYTTAELILPVHQPGLYPIHPHSLTAVTDNGLYPHGQITLIDAT